MPRSVGSLSLTVTIPTLRMSHPPTAEQVLALANVVARITVTVATVTLQMVARRGRQPRALKMLRSRLSMLKRRMRLVGQEAAEKGGMNPQAMGILSDGSVDLHKFKWGSLDVSPHLMYPLIPGLSMYEEEGGEEGALEEEEEEEGE